MLACASHSQSLDCQAASVEKDNVGWDIEARPEGGKILRIEVKRPSGEDITVELTPKVMAQ